MIDISFSCGVWGCTSGEATFGVEKGSFFSVGVEGDISGFK